MRKCIVSVFLMIAVLLLSGCGGRLSAEEYGDALKSQYKIYGSAQMDIVGDIRALDEGGTLPAGFEEHCKSFEKAMDGFGKIQPPNGLDYRHDLLLEALDNEREWLSAVRALTAADTPEDIERAEQRIMTAANYENSFPMRLMETLKVISDGV